MAIELKHNPNSIAAIAMVNVARDLSVNITTKKVDIREEITIKADIKDAITKAVDTTVADTVKDRKAAGLIAAGLITDVR